jgi:hypothetical protein
MGPFFFLSFLFFLPFAVHTAADCRPYSLFTMDFFLRKKSAMSSMSAASNSEGPPGQEKQEEANASDKEETKESDNKETANGSDEEEIVIDDEESTVTSGDDDDEVMNVSKEKTKATMNTGQNSPTRKGKRARPLTSDVWKSIVRLTGDALTLSVDKTHFCTHCNTQLKLYKSQSSWQTTAGLNHLANCPEFAKSENESKAVKTSKASKIAKKEMRQSVLMESGSQSLDIKGQPPVIGGFVVNRIDSALGLQARFYIYGRQRVSKRTFEDPAFIEMLAGIFVAGGGESKKFPKLSLKALKLWIVEEFEIFKGYMKMTCKDMLAFTEGNAFAQCLNDACTLANKHKCMAIGMEFVDCIHFKNHAVCLGMVPLADGTDRVGAKTIETVMTAVTGFAYNEIMAAMISDLAAKGIAREFDQVGEWCDMHQGDKIGRAAVGDLVRSKNKVPVNPFPKGQTLMQKCHSMAVHFSYGTRHKNLLKFTDIVPDGMAQIKLKVDLNDTRVSARHGLLYSEIRLNKGLKLYALANEQPSWQLTADQWQALTEVEAVLAISNELTVFVQNETAFTAAIGQPFKENMLTKLRSDTLSVVDLDQVTAKPDLIRRDVSLEDMTEVGRTCKLRATLEAERRYCGNTSEVLNNKAVERTDRDKLAVMLDPRTLISLLECGVTKLERGKLLLLLKEEYVKYGNQAQLYQQERKAAARSTDTEVKAIKSEKKTSFAAHVGTLGLDSESNEEYSLDGSASDESQNDIKLGEEFDAVYKRYKKACKALQWQQLFPKLPWAKNEVKFPFSLWDVDMGCVMKELIKQDPDKKRFGHLPMMAVASRGSIGGFLASSFCERINSCANLVLTDGNSLLSPDEINMLVTLRMNRNYMQFMRENHAKDGQHKRLLSEIRPYV